MTMELKESEASFASGATSLPGSLKTPCASRLKPIWPVIAEVLIDLAVIAFLAIVSHQVLK